MLKEDLMKWINKADLKTPKMIIRHEPFYGKDSYIFYDDEGFLCQISKEDLPDSNNAHVIIPKSRILEGPAYLVPVMVQVKITNSCNFSCNGCYANSGSIGSKEMSIKEITDILVRLAKWGVLIIQWVGGEVFFKKGFETLVAHAYELGFQQYLLTNGTAFGQNSEAFSEEAWGFFSSIQVSVDGVGDSFDKHVNRHGSWQTVKNGLCKLGKTKSENCQLKIASISTLKLASEIELVSKELSAIKGIDLWKLGKEISGGRSDISEQDSLRAQIEVWRKIQSMSFPFNVQTYFDKEETPEGISPEIFDDPGARDFMYIFHDGSAYPRPLMAGWKQFNGGNCLADSLEDIWYSKSFQAIRSITRKDMGCNACNLTCTQRGLDQRLNLFKNRINLKARPLRHPGCKFNKRR